MRKGQVVVEVSVVFWVFMLMVVAMYTTALITEQYSVAQLTSVAVCEMYAETNNISGIWRARIENYIPLLDQNLAIRGPKMDIAINSVEMRYNEEVGGTVLVPIRYDSVPRQLTCITTYRIFSENIPLLGQVNISGRAQYTTNRRYGPIEAASPRFPLQALAVLPVLPVGLITRTRLFRAKEEGGQALVEYAIIAYALLIPVLICGWSIVVTLDAITLASWGGVSLSAAALGPNETLTDIAFSWSGGNNSCSFTAGQAMDCNSGSPYSPLGENPGIPRISLSAGYVSIQIGDVW